MSMAGGRSSSAGAAHVPWGTILVQPLTHQVLKTNIRIDVVPSKHVVGEGVLSQFATNAALVCYKVGGGEYQFKSGVIITKVQARSNAVTYKLYINTISELKKETEMMEDVPLDPQSRKSRPRFWLRFFLGDFRYTDSTKFYLFIRRDEQRMHVHEMKYEESNRSTGSGSGGGLRDSSGSNFGRSDGEAERAKRKSMDSEPLPPSSAKRMAVESEPLPPSSSLVGGEMPVVYYKNTDAAAAATTMAMFSAWGVPTRLAGPPPSTMMMPFSKLQWPGFGHPGVAGGMMASDGGMDALHVVPVPLMYGFHSSTVRYHGYPMCHFATRIVAPTAAAGSLLPALEGPRPQSIVELPPLRPSMNLLRHPANAQICTQVVKPHISVTIDREPLVGVSGGLVEAELIYSFKQRSECDNWKHIAIPVGLFFKTTQPLRNEALGVGQVVTFRCHVGGWTSIKKFVKANTDGCSRDNSLKSNYGLRFSLFSTTGGEGQEGRRLVASQDYPRLFSLDTRRENDTNYIAKQSRARELRQLMASSTGSDGSKESVQEDESSAATQDDEKGSLQTSKDSNM